MFDEGLPTDTDASEVADHRVDRRTIAKGVAWTVPVIVLATAAPAAAASVSPITITATLGAKVQDDYYIDFNFSSQGGVGTVSITNVTGTAGSWVTTSGGPTPINKRGLATISLRRLHKQQAENVIVSYSYTTGSTVVTGTQAVSIPATPA